MSSGVYCVEDRGCAVAYQGSPNGAKQCTKHAVQGRADATWVFLMQQVDIYATRGRVTWAPRGDQRMLFLEATLK